MPVFADRPLSGLRYIFPRSWIEPSWPGHTGSILFESVTETRARLFLVGISFLVIAAVILFSHMSEIGRRKT